jgi:hypothetical protein
MFKKGIDRFDIILRDQNEDHQFARSFTCAKQNIAVIAGMGLDVVPSILACTCKITDFIADGVDRRQMQMAGFNRNNLVKKAGDMVAECAIPFDGFTFLHLLGGNPLFVAEGEFDFVAVIKGRKATQNRPRLPYLQMPDAAQGLGDLPFLVKQLLFVAQILPFAAAAIPKMLASGRNAVFGRFDHPLDDANGNLFFLACHAHVRQVTRHRFLHKNDEFVLASDAFAFVGAVDDGTASTM